MLPRTLDKARAILAGTRGAYEMPGLSAILLAELGISESEFFAEVRTGANDAEVAAWIAARRPAIDTERINGVLYAKSSDGNDLERLARDYYPWLRVRPIHRWMDIALADDELTFPPQRVDALFTPVRVRNLELANRFVMCPMTRNRSPSGIPGEDVAQYYRRRAEGETALIITEGAGIDHPAALGSTNIPVLYGAALDGWRRVVELVHDAGGKIVPQLWHQGVMREPGTGPYPEAPSSRPSGIWGVPGRRSSIDAERAARLSRPHGPLSEREIGDIIAAFARSARDSIAAGFDGIAIHGAHGYLPDAFFWEETNRRTDRWGGDAAGRAHFAAEVVRAVRAAIGEDYPIIFRFSQWKLQDYDAKIARTPAELEALLGPVADAGTDVFDASARNYDVPEFAGSDLNLAGWAKKLTGKLSMTVGGVGLNNAMHESQRAGGATGVRLDALVRRFEAGEFDLVGVGRSLLGDPHWTRKARLGLPFERFDDVAARKVLT
jgi:2,4-dienoyl-CoA reductase-like NADH-dependent reductase (Old Yellow Enzyme family)